MRPKKRLGQHFLTSVGYVEKILHLAQVKDGDNVLEIGPGKGALTRKLIEVGAKVTAIEFDPDMVSFIKGKYPQVEIIQADASSVDWRETIQGTGWKCVSNLPYNVGTKIVTRMLKTKDIFESITVMLQKEVGARMIATPGERKRGSLSGFVQAHAVTKKGFIVPPGAFFPPPRVDSIVISLIPRKEPLYHPTSLEIFEELNRALFSAPRKSIKNALRTALTKEEILILADKADFEFSLRAFNLNNFQIVHLAKILEEIR